MPLDLSDIQGNVFPGFKKDHQAFLFVRFPSPIPSIQARAWLAAIRLSIAAADEVQAFNDLYKIVHTHHPGHESEFVRATWLNVGFSYPGLQKLDTLPTPAGTSALQRGRWGKLGFLPSFLQGFVRKLLDLLFPQIAAPGFPASFTNGMHADPKKIGDVVTELPGWLIGGSAAMLPDAVVVIGADVRADLDSEIAHQRTVLLAQGLTEMAMFDGQSLGGGREHFGFRDNVTDPKPVPIGNPGGVPDGVDYTEFILDGGPLPHGSDPTPPAWTANGSYMVFRRLRQHVAEFRDRAASAATELNPFVPPAHALNGPFFQAKCFGRWPDGTPVSNDPSPVLPGPSTDITASDYTGDPAGLKIPRFSHIRKAHPRNLGAAAQRHRLIRRGIPYGPSLAAGAPDDGIDRGLLFVAYQASLSEQFEFLASQWLNFQNFPELDLTKVHVPRPTLTNMLAGEDPIVGANADQGDLQRVIKYPATATTTGSVVSITVRSVMLDRFVTMRGGGYFFCPGIASLAQLAGIP